MKFSKMHGLGNDFMVVDSFTHELSLQPEQIKAWSNRHTGVGFDQLLLLEPADGFDARYRIFNADGSVAGHCGNGARCVGVYMHEKGLSDQKILRLALGDRVIEVEPLPEQFARVNMGKPDFSPESLPTTCSGNMQDCPIEVDGQHFSASLLSMGNPHAVLDMTGRDEYDLEFLGQVIQSLSLFPDSVNVGFMQVKDPATIQLRVYERGAGETLACGTGACAAAVSGMVKGLLDQRVDVELKGGSLQIEWHGANEPVWMMGETAWVYEGNLV